MDRETCSEMLKSAFTVLMGGDFQGRPLRKDRQQFTGLFTVLMKAMCIDLHKYEEDASLCELGEPSECLDQIREQLFTTCHGRRPFFTDNTFAIGPSALQNGDIAILFGSPRPIASRPTNNWYCIVGPCYVNGMMDGEVVVRREEEGTEPQIIEIRLERLHKDMLR